MLDMVGQVAQVVRMSTSYGRLHASYGVVN